MSDAAGSGPAVAEGVRPPQAPLRQLAAEFAASKAAVVALVAFVLVLVLALAAPWIVPQDPYDLRQLDILDGRQPPGTQSLTGLTFWLGSDDQGRDMLSAIAYGLRISLLVALASGACALVLGVAAGLLAAVAGGAVDAVLMRIVDIQLSFPAILIALILIAVLGQGVDKVVVALVAVQWAYYARTLRATALVERQKEYVLAAVGLGLPMARILWRHLLPNCLPPLIVVATVQVARAVAVEATLSFLGLGLPITEPSLGLLIANGFEYLMSGKYWISFYPGVALLVVIVAVNLVGDQLRDVLNPRLRR